MKGHPRMNYFLTIALILALPLSAQAQPYEPRQCWDATEKLREQIDLYDQLSIAFQQSNQTLIEVYSTFSDKLATASPEETQRISDHFKRSSEELKKAQVANESILKDLKKETERLRKQVSWCTGTPVEARRFFDSVEFVQQTGRSVKVIYLARLGICEIPVGTHLIRDTTFGYRVLMSVSLRNCNPNLQTFLFQTVLWKKEIEVGPLEPGRHELRFENSPETYFSINVDVRN